MRFSTRLAVHVAAVACVGLAGCRSVPDRVTVFVSGDSRGYLEPCGCRRDQAGGLPGRARLVASVDPDARLVVDVGNLTAGGRAYELLKLKYLMQGMQAIGYDAVNLGKREAQLDLATLRNVLKESPLPFVSANVVAKEGGKPLTEPFRIVQRAGLKFGIVGVTACDPQDVGPGVEVRPAVETLAEIVPKLKDRCDYLVVLAFVDEDGIREIADKFHEVDCILGGDVPQSSATVQTVNRAIAFNVVGEGKVVGKINLLRKDDALVVESSTGVRIDADAVAAPAPIADLLARYKKELRDRRFDLASAEGLEVISNETSTADEFVGAQACTSCHPDAHDTWQTSVHSRAFATLQRKGSEFDPECLRCHTVGYGRSSGFVDEKTTPRLVGVQCENCHGRGKDHAATKLKAMLKPVTPSTCIACHDKENSEGFSYDAFWPKIAH